MVKVAYLFLYAIFFMSTSSFAQNPSSALFENLDDLELVSYMESPNGFYYFGRYNEVLFSSKNNDIPPSPYNFGTKEVPEEVLTTFQYSSHSFVSTDKNTYLISNSNKIIALNLILSIDSNSLSSIWGDPKPSNKSIFEYGEGFYLLSKNVIYHFSKKNAQLDQYHIAENELSFNVVYESPSRNIWERIEVYDKGKTTIYIRDDGKKLVFENIGEIRGVVNTSDYAWIHSDRAIAIWSFKLGAITFQENYSEDYRQDFVETVDYFWIESPAGNLYRLEKTNGSDPFEFSMRYRSLEEVGDEVFVLNEPHVYRIPRKGAGSPELLSSELGESQVTVIEGKSGIWFAGDTGVYLWQVSSPERIENRYPIQRQGHFWSGESRIYGSRTENGLLILPPGLDPYYFKIDWSQDRDLKFLDKAFLFVQDDHLLLWELKQPNSLTKLDIVFKEGTPVFVSDKEESHVLSIGEKVYELSKNTSEITKINESSDDRALDRKLDPSQFHSDLWIPISSRPLLVSKVETFNKIKEWGAKIIPESSIPTDISLNQEISLSWSIDDYYGQSDPTLINYSAILTNQTGPDLNPPDQFEYKFTDSEIFRLPEGKFRISLPPLDSKGNYRLEISAQDLFRNTVSYSKEFWAGRTQRELITELMKNIVSALIIINILSFIFLIITARWSSLCFEVLTDPVFRKIGIYFGVAVRYFRPIRLWLFRRYFDLLKEDYNENHIYLPAKISGHDTSIFGEELLDLVAKERVIWVSGDSGCGKTELVYRLIQEYTSHGSLKLAWKRYKFIPIVITARSFKNISANSYDWVSEAARLALSFYRIKLEDRKFFQNLLLKGDFLLIIDGMNEADRNQDFISYLSIDNNTKFIATSQTSISDPKICNYHFQPLSVIDANEILKLYLGDEQYQTTKPINSSLLSTLNSAYEIKLLSELINSGKEYPLDRLSIYKSMVELSLPSDIRDYPLYSICRQAWSLWKSGERTFSLDDKLTQAIVDPLVHSKLVIERGVKYEFRHDLIRAFLAANWAVLHATNIEQTKECLSEPEVFSLSASEQDLVFPFLVRLIKDEDILDITNYSLENPGLRSRLLMAISELTKERNLEIGTIIRDA
jgi:hypothetical protein